MNRFFIVIMLIIATTACKNNIQYNDPIPAYDSFNINSSILLESRHINVWKPSKYLSITDSLPVLYMLDGGIKEDFPHIANTVAALIDSGRLPPMILVGIQNTDRKRDLTSPSSVASDQKLIPNAGGAEKFRAFIEKELIPTIDSTYRTTSVRSIIGESLSGRFIVETLILQPYLFDNYIAFDPSLWWNNQGLVQEAQQHLSQNLRDKTHKLWYAGSSASDMKKPLNDLKEILSQEKYSMLIWRFVDASEEQHHTIFRAKKEEALVWTFGT